MTRYRVLPYKQGSKGAKALAEALGGKVLRLVGSTFKSKPGDTVINWGNGNYPDFLYSQNFNCIPLSFVTNKWKFFEAFKNTGCLPQHWTNKEEITHEDFPIVCRTVLSGHSGAGIHIANDVSGLVDCDLYVKYIKKKDEYRVHLGSRRVFVGDNDHDPANSGWVRKTEVISLQRKARRLDHPDPNWQVRNHANGFVYVRNDVNPPEQVLEVARLVFDATNLDFGAVDVIWNEHEKRAYVLEINTAPGLEGTTVTDYVEFFKNSS